jgi:hypothetical protein
MGTASNKKRQYCSLPTRMHSLLMLKATILPSQITHYYQQKSNCVPQAQKLMLECIKTQTERIQKHELPALKTQKSISLDNVQIV